MLLPSSVRERFYDYPAEELTKPEHRSFLVGRLLEEGNSDELSWLVASCGRQELTAWLRRHGARLLSSRSRAFWMRLLAVDEPTDAAVSWWPLA